ncbi:MAG: FecR domain-containing protein [candidate division NC10 bacterium]|nr:FecR domain-containing protein [candidate division NC10 bacterium]
MDEERMMATTSPAAQGRRRRKRLDWKVLIISRRALYTWMIILLLLLTIAGVLLYSFRETSVQERAKEAIASAEKSITRASRSGAETFAYERYSQATQELSKAKRFFDSGDYKTSYDHATRAENLARRTEVELADQGITAARFATVTGLSGRVEIKRPKDLTWQPASSGMKLSSEDQIRTFSNSQVQITFDDSSILRVKPNSLIVMGNLSEEVATSTRKTSVRLMVSEIEASIKRSGMKGSEFKIEMPTAVARAERANLAVQVTPQNDSRIRVFAGFADVSSGSKTVRVSNNQEITVTKDYQVVSSSYPLAPPPKLISPINMKQLTFPNPQQGKITFAWEEATGAKAYHLEVGQDQFFFDPILDLKPLSTVMHEVERLEAGTYFWRVSSINAQGSEGSPSDQEIFQVKYAAEGLPFRIDHLLVLAGQQGNTLYLQGTTEPLASLAVNQLTIQANEEGRFAVTFRNVPPGRFLVTFRVVSKKGGSATFQREIPVGTES